MTRMLTTPPAEPPVTLDELKLHLRITGDDEDDLLTALNDAATSLAEETTSRAFVEQEWEQRIDAFPCHGKSLEIPKAPLLTVDEIKYLDSNGVEQTVDLNNYTVAAPSGSFAQPGSVTPNLNYDWPTDVADIKDAVRIKFTAGYGDADAVPGGIKTFIKMVVGDAYQNREGKILGTIVSENKMLSDIIFPYKVFYAP